MPESQFPVNVMACNLLGKFTGSIALSIDLGYLCQHAAAEISNSLLRIALPLMRLYRNLVSAPVGSWDESLRPCFKLANARFLSNLKSEAGCAFDICRSAN